MLQQALERARAGRKEAESDFFEFLAIPSVSSLRRHDDDTRRACGWVAERLTRMGMKVEVAEMPGGRHPVIAAEWLGQPGAPTVAIYGHYDVQPVDPVDEWVTPPFTPTVRDGRVFARGACDNKGQVLAGIKAAEHAFATGGPPVNLRFLIEGEEEISGDSLPRFVRENAARLKTDYLFLADGEFTAPGLPNLLTALRGLLYTEIHAVGSTADLHSGVYGGVAPNPLNTLAHVISSLKGRDGRITIPGFYDRVRRPTDAELEQWRRPAEYAETLKRLTQSESLEGEAEYPLLVRQWARPTLDVHGMMGGFTGEGVKTVIPSRAMAKVSMRLVPDQDPKEILPNLKKYVAELGTRGVKIEVRQLGATRPCLIGADHAAAAAAMDAFEAAFGRKPRFVRSGGSIPVAIDLQEALNAPMVSSGLPEADSAPHSPNERYSLDHYHRGIEMLIRFMYALPTQGT